MLPEAMLPEAVVFAECYEVTLVRELTEQASSVRGMGELFHTAPMGFSRVQKKRWPN
jgi:hypothetical protein